MTTNYNRNDVEACVITMLKSIMASSTASGGVSFVGDERIYIGDDIHDIPAIDILEERVFWNMPLETTTTAFNIHYINVILTAINDHIKKDKRKYVGGYIHVQLQQLKKWRTKLHNRHSEERRGIMRQDRRPLDYNAKSKTLAEGAVLESPDDQLPFIKPDGCPHEIWFIAKNIYREFTSYNLKFETRPLIRKDGESDKRYQGRIVAEYIRIIHFNLRRQTAHNSKVLNNLKSQLEMYRDDIKKGGVMEVYENDSYNVVGDIITDLVDGIWNEPTNEEEDEVEYEYPTEDEDEDEEVSDAETIPYEEEEDESYSVVRDILKDIVNGIWSVPKPKKRIVFKIKRN